MYSPSIQRLIEQFSKFPTVGPRTASRFVFYLLGASEEEIRELADTILNLKKTIKMCSFCFKPFEPSFVKTMAAKGEEKLCEICSNPGRDRSTICMVEKETDLISIEKTKKYKGLYFVLGGTVGTLKNEEIENLRIKELKERIENPQNFGILDSKIKEIIIAVNPTTEGEATALYLERILKPLGKKITRLGRGLPVGAELEYADEETISSALEGRK